ncbi:MAG: cell division protein FtsZ [Gammaproteobacteria bacterium]|nr:cell division protein FtsZ [Gammaproteobacteria bacterium]
MFELLDTVRQQAVIKVIGIGGGGGNAVDHMVGSRIDGVEFINANTDSQTLGRSTAETILQLGTNLTKGLGAGAEPDIGRQAALEDRDRIAEALQGADMVFITAGLGGGTGTGAAPIVAQLAKEQGILTVAVVTRPFPFEGKKRMSIAEEGIEALSKHVDSLITIPNEKVLEVMGRQATLLDAFARANEVLQNAVQGISELITMPGLINVDFADVRTVMSEMGLAMMGSAVASGEDRAAEAARAAVSSPLLEDINISGARGILVNVTAGVDMAIGEFAEVGDIVREFASDDATVVIGTVLDPEVEGDLRVTMVATGIGRGFRKAKPYKVVHSRSPVATYDDLDTPTVIRNRRGGQTAVAAAAEEVDTEYLDIPAFLRKQAD